MLLVSGCTQQAPIPPVVTPTMNTTPAPTGMTTPMAADGKKMVTYTEADNGKTGDIAQNSRFAVQLAENPTTGFMWNATLSPGLELQSTDFRQSRPAAPGMVGVGGTRTWIILANNTGNQNFSAIYRRSWEPVTGNETAYSMNIRVITI
ncbi:MAG: protease inhibitor I42 family protein [Methanoregula sp.]|nr:protease inhibitor I42 family protein [Methanoregula sp.]